ncbi:MAG TPA: transporter [Micromonosporaceae bacterium]|nr:transporter [Micromonosporaceae bacterium]HCU50090.1 transporter [Micromonosporaceae bacterium]
MIWLAWRQHRKQALAGLAGLAVLAAILIPTGLQMYGALDSTGLAACLRKLGTSEFVPFLPGESCDGASDRFNNAYGSRATFAPLLAFLPLLAGMFWGAPLVAREVEHGTHRLVWTQGVTRLRWTVVKFGAVIGGAVIFASGYALLASWWMAPLSRASRGPGSGRFEYLMFDVQGVAPVGYTVFAVALGVFAGTLTRKVLPAMALTFAAFLGARVAIAVLARPNFQPPLERKFPVATDSIPNPTTGDWIMTDGIYDAKGNLIAANTIGLCHVDEADDCGGLDRFNVWTYHPGGRFWLFQYLETGLFAVLAAVLLYLAWHNIRRRIS